MEPAFQRLDLQFLDLSDATEEDQHVIERLLFSENCAELQLPWQTDKTCEEQHGPQHESLITPTDWNRSSGPSEVLDNETPVSDALTPNAPPRGAHLVPAGATSHFPPAQQLMPYAYIPTPQMFLNNGPYTPHYAPPPPTHPYHEVEPPRNPSQRKKLDKKSQEPPPPQSAPTAPPTFIPQYYHHPSGPYSVYPLPVYSQIFSPVVYPQEYHTSYLASPPESGANAGSAPYEPEPGALVQPVAPATEQQTASSAVPPPSIPVLIPHEVPRSQQTTTPPGFRVQTPFAEKTLEIPQATPVETKRLEANFAEEAAATAKPEETQTAEVVAAKDSNHVTASPSVNTNSAHIDCNKPESATSSSSCVNKPTSPTFPEEVQKPSSNGHLPNNKVEYPIIGNVDDTVHETQIPVANGVRSYASLLKPSAAPTVLDCQKDITVLKLTVGGVDIKGKPLARVPPFSGASKNLSLPDEDLALSSSKEVIKDGVVSNQSDNAVAAATVDVSAKFGDDKYAYELSEVLSTYKQDHRSLSLQPRGLHNRSNWCYVNAILQALLACPSFVNLIRALPKPRNARRPSKTHTPIIDSMIEFVAEFDPLPPSARAKRDKLMRSTKDDQQSSDVPTGNIFEPDCVYKVLNKIRGDSGFSVEGRQEDAEEFLSCLLNGLNDEMFEVMKLFATKNSGAKTTINGNLATATATAGNNVSDDDELGEWATVHGPRGASYTGVIRRADCGETPLSQMFRGQLRNRVQRAGSYDTNNVQPFFTLPLDIEKVNTVKEALELLVGKDQLEGVTCSKTNQEIEAWTQITLEDLPQILILHLKCFDYKQNGCSKILKIVEFPIDLKIDPKIMSINKSKYSTKQRSYKLLAVVYHDGKEATKGHYYTDAYHVGLGCWIRYDDQNVRHVTEANVLKPTLPRVPYLLYYRRSDTIANVANK